VLVEEAREFRNIWGGHDRRIRGRVVWGNIDTIKTTGYE
jgi:hypothetical protein